MAIFALIAVLLSHELRHSLLRDVFRSKLCVLQGDLDVRADQSLTFFVAAFEAEQGPSQLHLS